MEVKIVESPENAIEYCCHYWWRLGSDDSPTIGERRCMCFLLLEILIVTLNYKFNGAFCCLWYYSQAIVAIIFVHHGPVVLASMNLWCCVIFFSIAITLHPCCGWSQSVLWWRVEVYRLLASALCKWMNFLHKSYFLVPKYWQIEPL